MFDHNSLLGTGVMSQRILSISHRECTGGGGGGGGQNSMVHNSGSQQAIEMKLERSSKYIIQFILGENPGNPPLLINQ